MRYAKTVAAVAFIGIALLPLSSEASWWSKDNLLPCDSEELDRLVHEAVLDDFARAGMLDLEKSLNPAIGEKTAYDLREAKSPNDLRWLKVTFPDIAPENKRLCRGAHTIPVVVQTITGSGKLIGYVAGYGLGERETTFEYRAADAKKAAPKQAAPSAATELSASKVEGDYSSPGQGMVSLRTMILDESKKSFAAKVLTASERGCAGEFSGSGSLQGNVLKLVPAKTTGADQQCTVTLTFDKTGSTAKVKEDKCSYYHGEGCFFDGEVSKKR